MKRIVSYIALLAGVILLAACSDKDGQNSTSKSEVVTVNVDIILPSSTWDSWQTSINEALQNITTAQRMNDKQVKLNLRYHDEDTADLDKLAYALTHPGKGDAPYVQDDSCHAIIGPYYSDHARSILDQAQRLRLPVIMPICTSAELQRTEAHHTNSFFLTESDITQCEVMLSAIANDGYRRVALLCSDDTYGQSYYDWFGFEATQMHLSVAEGGIHRYTVDEDLGEYIANVARQYDESDRMPVALIVALGRSGDYTAVLDAVQHYAETSTEAPAPRVYVTDNGLCDAVLNHDLPVLGTFPVASAADGYMQYYYDHHGQYPPYGAAQMYDALCIIALGRQAQLYAKNPDELYIDGKRVEYEISPFEPNLSDWMRALLAHDSGPETLWTAYGLCSASALIAAGEQPNLCGATGSLDFDHQNHTTILHTNYMLWMSGNKGQIVPMAELSTIGADGTISNQLLWRWEAVIEEIDPNLGANVDHKLPDMTDRWAVIISPSTTWDNYRHQADALTIYQVLRRHGYDDDHIVLIVEDNLANDSRNPFPGEIYVERKAITPDDPTDLINDDIRKNAVIDYHFSDLTNPDDLAEIMLGHESDRLPHVIHPTASSNVFLFWSGHGSDNGGPLWGNEDSRQPFGKQRIQRIVEQMQQPRQYRRMMMAVETCYSGLWGEALIGQPDVLVLTAANAAETSKADVDAYDADLRTYLSNAFTRSFRKAVYQSPFLSLRDLYYSLARTTWGSHVSLYNIEQYGSVYRNTMADFLGEGTN